MVYLAYLIQFSRFRCGTEREGTSTVHHAIRLAAIVLVCMPSVFAADILQQPVRADVTGKFFLYDDGVDQLLVIPVAAASRRLDKGRSRYFGTEVDWVWITSGRAEDPMAWLEGLEMLLETQAGRRFALVEEADPYRRRIERFLALLHDGSPPPVAGGVPRYDIVRALMLHCPIREEMVVTLRADEEDAQSARIRRGLPWGGDYRRTKAQRPTTRPRYPPCVLAEALRSLLQPPAMDVHRVLCPLPQGVTVKDIAKAYVQEAGEQPVQMRRCKYYPGLGTRLDLPRAYRDQRVHFFNNGGYAGTTTIRPPGR